MNNITITSPTLADIDTLYEWGENNWQLWVDDNLSKDKWYSKKKLRQWFTNPGQDVLLVAKDGDKLIGICLTSHIKVWAFIDSLFIIEEYRSKGIGKIFLKKTLETLKKQGIDFAGLLVNVKNEKAIRFYKSMGLTQGNTFYWMYKDMKEEL